MKRTLISAAVTAVILATATSAMAQSVSVGEPRPTLAPKGVPMKAPTAVPVDAPVPAPVAKTGKTTTPFAKLVLPKVTGKVSALTEGKYVASSSGAVAWVADGDTRFSLCAPLANRTVACAPVASKKFMRGVDVQFAAKDGVELVYFQPGAASALTANDIAAKGGYFVQRLRKAAHALIRPVVSTTPRPWDNALTVGGSANAVMQGGSNCNYDDDGDYYCSGGAYDGGGGGGGGGGYDGGGSGDDFPSGNDNGDGGGSGSSNTSSGSGVPFPIPDGCVIGPFGLICTITGQRPNDPNAIPPVAGTPEPFPPNWQWPSIDWGGQARSLCETNRAFCYPVGRNDRYGDEEEMTPFQRRARMCWLRLMMSAGWCKAERIMGGSLDKYNVCLQEALDAHEACIEAAKNETGG